MKQGLIVMEILERGLPYTPKVPSLGTLGIPRLEMPQIKSFDVFKRFLSANGIDFKEVEQPVASLKMAQIEYNESKVKRLVDSGVVKKPIIISSDLFVIDGTHRFLSAFNQDQEMIPTLSVDYPGKDLLNLIKEKFEYATYESR